MAGRVAIVTGAGRGLGREMALGLARAGVRVVATAARERAEVEQVATEIRREFDEARVLPLLADVTREADCERVVSAALQHWQRLDILVNNAGRGMKYVSERFLTEPTRFWEVTPETWRMVIETNVNGPFLMARSGTAYACSRLGRIVNMSMNHETMRRRGFSPYGPSKAALESETVIWAQDLEGTGFTVNALLPGGAALTGMIPQDLDEHIRAQLLAPRVVVAPLLWLASQAADHINGQRLLANCWRDADPAAAFRYDGWGA
ncbi:SDR family oxidoreductase (plasmid) [Pseudomonas umsongensis]|nr:MULTISPECIES: SDR family oxidoreductase [Pseudomonas]QFG27755.1 SDR family oxidoreductase [Pseudomonas umsongensis]UPU95732.1 SDR family oxidoreductase [Pseudomonas putida]